LRNKLCLCPMVIFARRIQIVISSPSAMLRTDFL
jgi:hypothetical protein